MIKHFLLSLFLSIPLCLFGESFETFYGTLEIEEPVVGELIRSEAFQRLKDVRQYGVSYYTTHQDPYNRYDHSLGVFAILRLKGADFNEQLAGLLHDISHTVFSHVGDWVFDQIDQDYSFQDDIHHVFLVRYGIAEILEKHGLKVTDVLHKSGGFSMLEDDLPNLCADRIDYNLQGAYHQGFMTKAEILELLEDLYFEEGRWISTRPDLMKKMVAFSLHMTRHCWGSPENYVSSEILASAIKKGVDSKVLTMEDVLFGRDDFVYEKLLQADDLQIQCWMKRLSNFRKHYEIVSPKEADIHPVMKFRGVDPWIRKGKRVMRLTKVDKRLGKKYSQVRSEMEKGWPLRLHWLGDALLPDKIPPSMTSSLPVTKAASSEAR